MRFHVCCKFQAQTKGNQPSWTLSKAGMWPQLLIEEVLGHFLHWLQELPDTEPLVGEDGLGMLLLTIRHTIACPKCGVNIEAEVGKSHECPMEGPNRRRKGRKEKPQ